MTAAILSMLLSALAVLIGTEAALFERSTMFARFRARINVATASRGGLPGAALRNETLAAVTTHQSSIPVVPRPECLALTSLPAFTAPAMSDGRLTCRCLCGSWSMHRGLLSDRATCVACMRTWLTIGTQHWFVPTEKLGDFSTRNRSGLGGDA